MKFSCEKAILQTAVTTAGRVVAPKSSIQALEGVLIEAAGDSLSLSGYNLETGIITTVSADVTEGGAIVLSARLFGEILRARLLRVFHSFRAPYGLLRIF